MLVKRDYSVDTTKEVVHLGSDAMRSLSNGKIKWREVPPSHYARVSRDKFANVMVRGPSISLRRGIEGQVCQ